MFVYFFTLHTCPFLAERLPMAAGGREPGGFEAGASACLRLASLTMALHCVQSRRWASRQLLVAQPLPPTRPGHSTVLAHAVHSVWRLSRQPLPTQPLPPTPSHGTVQAHALHSLFKSGTTPAGIILNGKLVFGVTTSTQVYEKLSPSVCRIEITATVAKPRRSAAGSRAPQRRPSASGCS